MLVYVAVLLTFCLLLSVPSCGASLRMHFGGHDTRNHQRALPHDDSSAVAYLQNCPRAVVHLVDPSALLCARVDLHLEVCSLSNFE
jgi:hypothetical protein